MLNKNIMHLHSEILKNFIFNINYQFFSKVNKKNYNEMFKTTNDPNLINHKSKIYNNKSKLRGKK